MFTNLKSFLLQIIVVFVHSESLVKAEVQSLGFFKDGILKNMKSLHICDIKLTEANLSDPYYKDLKKNFFDATNLIQNSVLDCNNNKEELSKNETCNFIRAVDHPNESFYSDGRKIGLNEVNNFFDNETILPKDQKLISEGANEMRRQLLDLSLNGQAIRNLLVTKSNAKYFSNTSGFVLSNVRYLRAFYCVQKMAKELKNYYIYQYNDDEAILYYSITGVWIGNQKIINAMENVVNLRNDLLDKVNKKTSTASLDELKKFREDISSAIKNVAVEEEEFKQQNGNKGSSMALVGYFALDRNPKSDEFSKCTKNNISCVVYFHISARNDLSMPNFSDPDLEE